MVAAPYDGIQDPYLVTLNLTISEHLKLYNKAIIGFDWKWRVWPNQIQLNWFLPRIGGLYIHILI